MHLAWLGPTELIVILVVALLLFGPRRLPEIGQAVGKGIREFKDAITPDREGDSKKGS
jgi:sec-independent protein translocase protein TatA